MDERVEITAQLISKITWMSIQGEDPHHLFEKESEKSLAQDMYEKYGTTRGKRGILISMINNGVVKIVSQLMACNLLRKCKKDQCFVAAVIAAKMCVAGVQMRWAPFLLNQLILDWREEQKKVTKFHFI